MIEPDAGSAVTRRGSGQFDEEADDPPFRRWSRAEAEALRSREPSVSPWRVIALQSLVGVACAGLAWVVTGQGVMFRSASYGAATVVVPNILLARGMTRGTRTAVGAAAGFLFWEMLKIGVAVAMLAIATQVVHGLSWPALLVAMIVCIKANWLALLWRPRKTNPRS